MARRRSAGEGSIFFWELKGLWVSKITLPDGTSKYKYGKTQKEVRDHHQALLHQLRQGILPNNDTITVSDFLAHYMETMGKHTLLPRTQEMQDVFVCSGFKRMWTALRGIDIK